MEESGAEKQSSYTYWVREVREDAAPLPVPRKLSADDISKQTQPAALGSVWNQAGTWEEKNLNSWASNRIKVCSIQTAGEPGIIRSCLPLWDPWDFLTAKQTLQKFQHAQATLSCSLESQDFYGYGSLIYSFSTFYPWPSMMSLLAFLVTVRNKKRVGYTYELTLKFEGEWLIKEESRTIKGHIDIPEFSFGELEDLQMEVQLSEGKDLEVADKQRINKDVKLFLQPIRERLLKFEQELKDR